VTPQGVGGSGEAWRRRRRGGARRRGGRRRVASRQLAVSARDVRMFCDPIDERGSDLSL